MDTKESACRFRFKNVYRRSRFGRTGSNSNMDAKAGGSRFCFRNVYRRKRFRKVELPISKDICLWDNLDDATIESILSRTFEVDYFRCQLVCKRWRDILRTASFMKAVVDLGHHLPWFLAVNNRGEVNVVYDVQVNTWRPGRFPLLMDGNEEGNQADLLASSNGLLCVMTQRSHLIVCNPLTGSQRRVAKGFDRGYGIQAVVLHASKSSYKLFLVSGTSDLCIKIYASQNSSWTEIQLKEKLVVVHDDVDEVVRQRAEERMKRILKKYVKDNVFDVTTILVGGSTVDHSGRLMVYYVHPVAGLFRCDIQERVAYIYPSPSQYRYFSSPIIHNKRYLHMPYPRYATSFGRVVECRGRILVLVHSKEAQGNLKIQLSEFKHDDEEKPWKDITTLPEDVTARYNGIHTQVECAGCDDYVMVCISAVFTPRSDMLMYNALDDAWVTLPPYFNRRRGCYEEIASPFAIMPEMKFNF